MKKIMAVLFLTLFILLTVVLPVAAFAEEIATETADLPASVDVVANEQPADQPYTWAYLATLAGATAATLLIVQFLKVPLDKVWRIPTRMFVYIVALIILLVATAFTEGLTLQNTPLAAVNAFLVALTAYGAYDVTFSKLTK